MTALHIFQYSSLIRWNGKETGKDGVAQTSNMSCHSNLRVIQMETKDFGPERLESTILKITGKITLVI